MEILKLVSPISNAKMLKKEILWEKDRNLKKYQISAGFESSKVDHLEFRILG